eukprot:gene8513-9385_t
MSQTFSTPNEGGRRGKWARYLELRDYHTSLFEARRQANAHQASKRPPAKSYRHLLKLIDERLHEDRLEERGRWVPDPSWGLSVKKRKKKKVLLTINPSRREVYSNAFNKPIDSYAKDRLPHLWEGSYCFSSEGGGGEGVVRRASQLALEALVRGGHEAIDPLLPHFSSLTPRDLSYLLLLLAQADLLDDDYLPCFAEAGLSALLLSSKVSGEGVLTLHQRMLDAFKTCLVREDGGYGSHTVGEGEEVVEDWEHLADWAELPLVYYPDHLRHLFLLRSSRLCLADVAQIGNCFTSLTAVTLVNSSLDERSWDTVLYYTSSQQADAELERRGSNEEDQEEEVYLALLLLLFSTDHFPALQSLRLVYCHWVTANVLTKLADALLRLQQQQEEEDGRCWKRSPLHRVEIVDWLEQVDFIHRHSARPPRVHVDPLVDPWWGEMLGDQEGRLGLEGGLSLAAVDGWRTVKQRLQDEAGVTLVYT